MAPMPGTLLTPMLMRFSLLILETSQNQTYPDSVGPSLLRVNRYRRGVTGAAQVADERGFRLEDLSGEILSRHSRHLLTNQ